MSQATHVVNTKGGPIQHPAENRIFVDDPPVPGQRDPIETMPNGSFSSTNVHSGLFDFADNALFMRYLRDGQDAIYRYWNVPTQTWRGLVEASSKGGYVNSNIAYNYRYAKLGRGDFPRRGDLRDGRLRRFVFSP
jgi:hypothetical protein